MLYMGDMDGNRRDIRRRDCEKQKEVTVIALRRPNVLMAWYSFDVSDLKHSVINREIEFRH